MATSLDDVRREIDTIDAQLVGLLAARERLVRQAATFKKDDQGVRAPARVEQVISKVRALAVAREASPDVVERVYRAMIAAFIDLELAARTPAARPGATPPDGDRDRSAG